MKLLYTLAFALFPVVAGVAAPAPSADLPLLTALCQARYHDDKVGWCVAVAARASATLEEVLDRYASVVTDDELAILNREDPADMPVGSISPRSEASAAPQTPRAPASGN